MNDRAGCKARPGRCGSITASVAVWGASLGRQAFVLADHTFHFLEDAFAGRRHVAGKSFCRYRPSGSAHSRRRTTAA